MDIIFFAVVIILLLVYFAYEAGMFEMDYSIFQKHKMELIQLILFLFAINIIAALAITQTMIPCSQHFTHLRLLSSISNVLIMWFAGFFTLFIPPLFLFYLIPISIGLILYYGVYFYNHATPTNLQSLIILTIISLILNIMWLVLGCSVMGRGLVS